MCVFVCAFVCVHVYVCKSYLSYCFPLKFFIFSSSLTSGHSDGSPCTSFLTAHRRAPWWRREGPRTSRFAQWDLDHCGHNSEVNLDKDSKHVDLTQEEILLTIGLGPPHPTQKTTITSSSCSH